MGQRSDETGVRSWLAWLALLLGAALLGGAGCIPLDGASAVRCEGVALDFFNTREGTLEEARAAWARLKASRGGSYCYLVDQSSFSGFSATTAIHVAGDVVVKRAYHEFSTNQSRSSGDTWVEETGEIGQHRDGAPADTIEALHDRCATEVLTQDPRANDITLLVDSASGVLRSCTFCPRGCVDDCTFGVHIDALSLAK